ncbi:Fic/DOC family protein [Campylobacter sp. MG1]|uniref:Fic/DOC family protein n=1 Tax=Campylobacter sp. MG1 TaxID=2976332 RepID=UPI00226CED4E|nr:Fic family protein [Campylobacter sp. MG1]
MKENKLSFEELVTKNKLGIEYIKEFDKASRIYTLARAEELKTNPIKGNFDYEHLKAIHKHIFQDVFSWAGLDRDDLGLKNEFKKLAPNGTYSEFVPGIYLKDTAKQIFDFLKEDNYLKDCKNIDEFASALSEVYRNIDYLHPFREGNGRTERIFLNQLAQNAGYKLDLGLIDKDKLIQASAMANQCNLVKLKTIILKNLKSFKENNKEK